MIKIEPPIITTIDKEFQAFSKKALKKTRPDRVFVISHLQKYEKSYKREGLISNFVQKARQLAEDFDKKGATDFTGIIYASLIKIKTLAFDIRENLIKRAIEIAQKQNDTIHELGRVVDLKMLYRANIQVKRKGYIKTLLAEEKLLSNIVRNFDQSVDNYKTVRRNTKLKDEYLFKLGLSKVDIAKQFINTNRKLAKEKLVEAKKIFQKLGKSKEEFFVNGLIEQIKH